MLKRKALGIVLPALATASLSGTAAMASSVLSVDAVLSYTGDTYIELEVELLNELDEFGDPITNEFGELLSADDTFGLPRLLPALAPGDVVTFSSEYTSESGTGFGSFGVQRCSFAGIDCSFLASAEVSSSFVSQDFNFLEVLIEGGLNPGDEIELYDLNADDLSEGMVRNDDVSAFWRDQLASFTVVSSNIATVPLSGTAAFLALGLAGLALTRRRSSKPTG